MSNQLQELEKVEKKHGGKRKGAGMPKGKKTTKIIARELELQYIKDRVAAAKSKLLDSQLTLASGVSFLFKIEKTKITRPKGGISYKPERPKLVTNQFEIEEYLAGLIQEGDNEDEYHPAATYYYITTEKPDNSAIDSLLDRTVGKPKQITEMTGKDGKDLIPETTDKVRELIYALTNKTGGIATD